MTAPTSVTDLGAAGVAAAISRGELSAVEAVEAHIARIEAINPALNAVVVPLFEDARERARAADQVPPGRRGPLHGVPVTVKECYDVTGTPSTVGLVGRRSHRATDDAPSVARLRQAGAIVVGKTNVSQLLLYVESDNPVYGRTANPWHPERSCGGSSGGEGAIVAARGSALGLGTDVGGSVRIPAHCCGITSLKPTPGRLSVEGTVMNVGPAAQDGIPDSGGLLARTVADLRLGYTTLAGQELPPRPLPGLRIGVYDDDGYFPASTAIRRAISDAASQLRDAGCEVVAFAPPDVRGALDIFYGLFGADGGDEWRERLAGGATDPRMKDLVRLAGAPNALRPVLSAAMRLAGQPRLAHVMGACGRLSEQRVAALVGRRDEYRRRFAAAMAALGLDALLCTPCAVPAFRHGSTRELGPASVSYTCLYNLLAYPAGVVTTSSVGAGETADRPPGRERMQAAARRNDQGSEGLPVGVQVVSGPGREDAVLAVMEALERGATWSAPRLQRR